MSRFIIPWTPELSISCKCQALEYALMNDGYLPCLLFSIFSTLYHWVRTTEGSDSILRGNTPSLLWQQYLNNPSGEGRAKGNKERKDSLSVTLNRTHTSKWDISKLPNVRDIKKVHFAAAVKKTHKTTFNEDHHSSTLVLYWQHTRDPQGSSCNDYRPHMGLNEK